MKRIALAVIFIALPAMAADEMAKTKPLPQDSQIKLLKAQRQFQQLQMQVSSLQRQYEQAVKDARDIQSQMANDCASAAKQSNVDLSKFTCDLDTLSFVPRAEEKKPEAANSSQEKK